MQQKHNKYTIDNQPYPMYQFNKQSPNQPIKSPSPDKKRANIITPTKSPQLIDIKRNLAQSRISDKKFQKTPIDSKPYEQSTRYYTNEDFQEYRSSQKKNQVFEQLQNMMPAQFVLDNSLQYRSQAHPTSKQLDYLRLLQQKQRTIKQLHQIIEMINRNNSLQLSSSSISGTKQKRIFDSSNKTVFSYKSNDLATQKQLKNQVRILTIQNQQLIHMIQKLNKQHLQFEIMQKQYKKQQIDYNSHRMKEQILSRQIYEMKESLSQKDQDYNNLFKENKQIYGKYVQLDQQNQKLIKMMKDKQLSDRKYHNSLIESNISQQSNISQRSNISESHNKQKLSIMKIKQQYNQSLKVFKDTVYGDVQDFMREIQNNTKGLQNKLQQMEQQLKTLQKFKLAYQSLKLIKQDNLQQTKRQQQLKRQIKQELKQNKQQKQQHKQQNYQLQKNEIGQISNIQFVSPQKQRYRQIQSLLIQKNEIYQKQLDAQRQVNKQIRQQIQQLRTKHELLQSGYGKLLQQNSKMNIRLRIQMSESRNKYNMQQIQDINIAKSNQLQLQKLKQYIQKYQSQYIKQKQQLTNKIINLQNNKQQLINHINILNIKNQSYQQIIESQKQQYQLQKQQYEQKNIDVITRISQKQHQLKRNSSKYQSQIDYLKQLISQKQISQIPLQQNLQNQVENLKLQIKQQQTLIKQQQTQLKQQQTQLKQQQTQLKQQSIQLKQKLQQLKQKSKQLKEKQNQVEYKSNEINEWRQRVNRMQEGQYNARKDIQKLVQNYEKQINILKINHQNEYVKYKVQIDELKTELRRLISQSQNREQLLLVSQSNSETQIDRLKIRIQQLQRQLNSKNKQSRQLLDERQVLRVQQQQMRDNLQELLIISSKVQQQQQQNRRMKQKVIQYEIKINKLQQTINNKCVTIKQQQFLIQSNKSQINLLSKDKYKNQQAFDLLQSQIVQLQQKIGIVIKQSQDRINQKDIDFTVQIQKYQQQKIQYQSIINQLKTQLQSLNNDIDLLRQQNINHQSTYNQLLSLKLNHNLINQLYQLRQLVSKSIPLPINENRQDKQIKYDIGRLYIEYESKIDQNRLLYKNINDIKQQINKSNEQKNLLQQKIQFLQKNINIYQKELKQRKVFCQQIIVQKNKLQKQLLLIKKIKIQFKQQQHQSIKHNLIDRLNHLVQQQEIINSQIKNIQSKKSQSPIRKINSLISKVSEFDQSYNNKIQTNIL